MSASVSVRLPLCVCLYLPVCLSSSLPPSPSLSLSYWSASRCSSSQRTLPASKTVSSHSSAPRAGTWLQVANRVRLNTKNQQTTGTNFLSTTRSGSHDSCPSRRPPPCDVYARTNHIGAHRWPAGLGEPATRRRRGNVVLICDAMTVAFRSRAHHACDLRFVIIAHACAAQAEYGAADVEGCFARMFPYPISPLP